MDKQTNEFSSSRLKDERYANFCSLIHALTTKHKRIKFVETESIRYIPLSINSIVLKEKSFGIN